MAHFTFLAVLILACVAAWLHDRVRRLERGNQ